MSGRIKHMQRSHRSYGHEDAAFRGFAIKAHSNKTFRKQRKSFAEALAGLFAGLHRHQDK